MLYFLFTETILRETVSDIWNVKTLYCVHYNESAFLDIADLEFAAFDSFVQYLDQKRSLFTVDYGSRPFDLSDIPEESRSQRPVARNNLAHSLKTASYIFLEFLLGRNRLS